MFVCSAPLPVSQGFLPAQESDQHRAQPAVQPRLGPALHRLPSPRARGSALPATHRHRHGDPAPAL